MFRFILNTSSSSCHTRRCEYLPIPTKLMIFLKTPSQGDIPLDIKWLRDTGSKPT